jgi:hypothetical protein
MSDENTTVIVRLEKYHEYKLIVKVGLWAEVVSQPFTDSALQNLIGLFRNTLQKIHTIYGKQETNNTEQQKINNLNRSIAAIYIFNSYFKLVIGEQAYSKIQQQLADLISGDREKRLLRCEQPIGRIIYEGNIKNFIPLDFLIIKGKNDITIFNDVALSLSKIVGFSFMINRYPTNLDSGHIEYDKQLGINIYTDENLFSNKDKKKLIAEEFEFFKKNKNFLAKKEEPRNYENISQDIIKQFTNVQNVKIVNIHHFCCHGDTSCNEDWDYHLIFGRPKLAESPRAKLVELIHYSDETKPKMNNAIVFINACGSAVIEPNNLITFPKLFLEHLGAKGFIGTEYSMLTRFACEFSTVFYAHLLNTQTLDIALFKTRWYFAKKEINPLGLFYTLYAAPNLKLLNKTNSVPL